MNSETLISLRTCRTLIRFAAVDAMTAARSLDGARHTRAIELADKLTDALEHCGRLAVVVEGDLRCSEAVNL
jgi:hypothetical protein